MGEWGSGGVGEWGSGGVGEWGSGGVDRIMPYGPYHKQECRTETMRASP